MSSPCLFMCPSPNFVCHEITLLSPSPPPQFFILRDHLVVCMSVSLLMLLSRGSSVCLWVYLRSFFFCAVRVVQRKVGDFFFPKLPVNFNVVLTAVTAKCTIFCYVALCTPVEIHRRLGVTYSLHLQGIAKQVTRKKQTATLMLWNNNSYVEEPEVLRCG
jgi:hypothetical protein